MYLNFFALTREPFAMASVESEIFTSATHRETLSAIIYGLRARKPLIAVIGEAGTGKTTILRAVLTAMSQYKYSILNVTNPLASAEALLRRIALFLDMSGAGTLTLADLDRVHTRIMTLHGEENRLAIVTDEAQALPPDALELLRLLSNYDASRRGIMQIVLVGQTRLWDHLQRPELANLRDRIAIRAVLSPLTRTEATAYLEYRFSLAGSRATDILTPDSLALLLDHAAGIPRRLNTIVDNAMITAFGAGQKPVSKPLMQEALASLGFEIPAPQRDMRLAFTVLGPPALFAAAMIFAAILSTPSATGHVAAPTKIEAPERPAAQGAIEVARPSLAVVQPAAPEPAPALAAAETVTLSTPVFTAIPTLAPVTAPPAPAVISPAVPAVVRPPADNLPAVQRPSTTASQRTASHQVKVGDTVTSLLQRYAGRSDPRTLGEFRTLNPTLPNSNVIQPGQTLIFPLTTKLADVRVGD